MDAQNFDTQIPDTKNLDTQKLDSQFDQLRSKIGALVDALKAERDAVASHSVDQLELATNQKRQVLDQLEPLARLLIDPQIRQDIERAPTHSRTKLELRHKQLIDQARLAKEFNAVNGKILARSQQSLSELIGLLTKSDEKLTYGSAGQVETTGRALSTRGTRA